MTMAIICLLSALCLMSRRDLGVHAFTAATLGPKSLVMPARSSSSTPRFDRHSCFASSVRKRNNIVSSTCPLATRAAIDIDAGKGLVLFASNNDDNDDGKNDNRNNNNNEDKDENPITSQLQRRLQRADFSEIQKDVILVSCFVLGRYFLHDITTGEKLVPGFDIQDIVWLTGTLSSAALLGLYWTAAGLLTRLFEIRGATLPMILTANAVNIAMCCPLWIASEKYFQFGPPDIGGPTLGASIANGFLGLASFMAVIKTTTLDKN
mmetsp:Transcript_34654/g.62402  ORF Transcript_34654/g.62402 Transcript_34654/m.62402 type:complete len:265 (+) Transcript_34654:86-880(+)